MSTESKISKLKDQINQGLYRVDARAIAKAILAYERRNNCPALPTVDVPVQTRRGERWSVSCCRQGRSYRRPSTTSSLRERKLSRRRKGNPKALFL